MPPSEPEAADAEANVEAKQKIARICRTLHARLRAIETGADSEAADADSEPADRILVPGSGEDEAAETEAAEDVDDEPARGGGSAEPRRPPEAPSQCQKDPRCVRGFRHGGKGGRCRLRGGDAEVGTSGTDAPRKRRRRPADAEAGGPSRKQRAQQTSGADVRLLEEMPSEGAAVAEPMEAAVEEAAGEPEEAAMEADASEEEVEASEAASAEEEALSWQARRREIESIQHVCVDFYPLKHGAVSEADRAAAHRLLKSRFCTDSSPSSSYAASLIDLLVKGAEPKAKQQLENNNPWKWTGGAVGRGLLRLGHVADPTTATDRTGRSSTGHIRDFETRFSLQIAHFG